MWVSPELRRTGVGRALATAVCEWARERGATRAGLWVREANVPAHRLYERERFEQVEAADGAGGLRLERPL
jgi:GNAT superfamily N-acetyltransferase